jgi:signal transduction histidine kinase/ligand-binding sensor domain-containing protein
MKFCRLSSLLLVMLQLYFPTFSQDAKIVALTKYTQNEGLSSYFVTKILKDSYGFMWIGTQEGLSLFDGRNFHTFSRQAKEKNRLGGSFVSEIIEDKKRGLLWVNTTYGDVCAIDLNTRTVTRRITKDRDKAALTGKWVRAIALRGDILWLGGLGVLSAYDLQKGEFISTDFLQRTGMNPGDVNIAKLTFDNKGRLWIFSDGFGVCVLDSTYRQAETIRSLNNGRPEKTKLRFWDLTFRRQLMYVATSWGLRVFDTGKTSLNYIRNTSGSIADTSEIYSLSFSADRLFFSTPNQFYSYDLPSGTTRAYRDQDTEEDWLALTYQVLCDTITQQIWAGTQSGLAMFEDQRTPFNSFSKSTASRTMIKHAYSLLPLDNYVYCGDENGLFYVNTLTKEIEKIDNGSSNLLLFRDNEGVVFLSNKSGFHTINGKKIQPAHISFPVLKPLEEDHFSCALQYNDSLVLFGSVIQKGLTVWNKRSASLLRYHNDSMPYLINKLSIINNLYKSSNSVLILTEFGIISFHPLTGQSKTYSIKNERTGEVLSNLMDICETADSYWIGTYGNGLVQTDKNFRIKKIISTTEGLSNNCVYKIFSYQNAIIATTNFGLNIVNATTSGVQTYFQSDGLHSSSFEQVCGYQYRGKIYAGGVNGFTIIDPTLLFSNPRAPDLYLNKITIQTSRNITDTFNLALKELTIPNNVLQVDISLSGLNYNNPLRTTYSYKRSGDDDKWTELGTQNFISLIAMPPGRHTLVFRSANEAGVYSERQVSLSLVYLPKWYQHFLFKIFIALLVAAILYALYRNRLAQLKKQQQIRKDIASDLHDDIGSILNSVKIYTHLAKREPDANHLDKIEDSLAQATLGLRDMLWVLDDSGDTVYGLMERIKKYAMPVCHAKGIEFESVTADASGKMLTKAEKRNLLLIAKEAINNSIKYSDCHRIQVELKQSANKTALIIKDDGKGFDESIANGGNGLKNIQYRAQQIKAVAKIRSSKGEGTVVEMVKG